MKRGAHSIDLLGKVWEELRGYGFVGLRSKLIHGNPRYLTVDYAGKELALWWDAACIQLYAASWTETDCTILGEWGERTRPIQIFPLLDN